MSLFCRLSALAARIKRADVFVADESEVLRYDYSNKNSRDCKPQKSTFSVQMYAASVVRKSIQIPIKVGNYNPNFHNRRFLQPTVEIVND